VLLKRSFSFSLNADRAPQQRPALDCFEVSSMQNTHYDELLARQLVMNQQTWVALQGHGASEQTELRLEFSYNASNRESADALCAFLRDETDYEIRVESSGSLLRREWRVEGTTLAKRVSPASLDEWVTWMVIAGKEKACDFDGWGTSV
jgi:hypothetical protein